MVLASQMAVIPAGRPDAFPIPVAPIVEWVIFVNEVLTHSVGFKEAKPTVFAKFTVMVPVA